MFGAWGNATKSGTTIQLRALDWDMQGPFKDYPLVVVYHPTTNMGHSFVNVGFVGWIGSLSGMSSTQLGISQIGVSFPDNTFGPESRIGVPFTFLLRDILQFDTTVQDSIHRITTSKRTCDLILGVGDGKANIFRGFQYSSSVANVYDDTNLHPVNDTWHPKIENVVYWGMDWLCPGYNRALAAQLTKYHGSITPEITMQYITSIAQTGDLHIGIYDLSNKKLWVSYARATYETGALNAYDRQFTELDTVTLFAEQQPTF